MRSQNQINKALVSDFWGALDAVPQQDLHPDQFAAVQKHLHPRLHWRGCEPLGELSGGERFVSDFWIPFRRSFSDLSRDFHILMGGRSSGRVNAPVENPLNDPLDGRMWVAATGLLTGKFEQDFVGIPANNKVVTIRWGEFCRVENGQISEIFLMLDLLDLALQAGHRLLPESAGREGIYPPPAAGDGVMLTEQDATESDFSLDHIRRFIFDGLEVYDQENLESMGMAKWFHPDLKWYGPTGIGACLSFTEFETLHQKPWLKAFPDRKSGDLHALVGEGFFTAVTEFYGMHATQTGEYLGHPATHNKLQISGLDFWKRDGDVLTENWVFVDMIGLFRQLGVDLLGRIRR